MTKIRRGSYEEVYELEQVTRVHVFTTSIDNSTWIAIKLPVNHSCESALCKCRSATNVWKMASSASGSPYITFAAGDSFTLDIDKESEELLFFVQGTEASDTFEVVLSA